MSERNYIDEIAMNIAAVQRIDEATHERDERARAALAAVDGE